MRGPEAVRPSRPRRQRGIGAQAKSQLCSRTSRHRRALVIGLGWASAGFTVVSAVGTRPPHDGHSGDRPSTVECAVQEGGNPELGMTSPTSPAGTSRSSGRTEHGDGRSPRGADLTTELRGADLRGLPMGYRSAGKVSTLQSHYQTSPCSFGRFGSGVCRVHGCLRGRYQTAA